ncbi:hypothetical protein HJC23_010872 [Cyclotella cryptica]|uniref:VDE lipocalin domain-containing protein n=1 Tax=Cyclotella cryptica TaxID=29204 RepID=A0ABD3QRA7_9STRA|eukprot:CCRYP_003636-RA/>CCRYP_003636-RA protein AED:0.08 eAED:0.08 QI:469/1/1/1/1/1/4/210/585
MSSMRSAKSGKRARSWSLLSTSTACQASIIIPATIVTCAAACHAAFVGPNSEARITAHTKLSGPTLRPLSLLNAQSGDESPLSNLFSIPQDPTRKSHLEKSITTVFTTLGFSALFLTNPLLPHLPYSPAFSSANAEDELYAKYGGKGLDTSLVDKDCLMNKCSLQAKACLQDDPDCRKGLTCTAKCLGDNSCITGCFARYGTPNLDGLLKCTIEDNECIKVAILKGGGDEYGHEPKSPAPTVRNFDLASMEGTWYKVAGYNPNYDCYACQRNTFSAPEGGWSDSLQLPTGGLLGAVGNAFGNIGADRLQVDVEFSMPRLLPDGSPPPPSGVREEFGNGKGLISVAYNQYSTHETMVFDSVTNNNGIGDAVNVLLGKAGEEKLYSRTAHSEGEMFGLKFWENWYIIGQNDPGQDEFKFIYYNGKTRQNTYDGAFIYSRTRTLTPATMEKVYKIAKDAGMNPNQFCKIENSCFDKDAEMMIGPRDREGLGSPSNPFRGILASTKISQFLGVESVAAEPAPRYSRPITTISSELLQGSEAVNSKSSNQGERSWWKEMGDYLEDPRRHFRLMDSLRKDMDWPEYIRKRN